MRKRILALVLLMVWCVPSALAQNDEYDVRKVRWGMTRDEVKASESEKLVLEDADSVAYQETLFNKRFFVLYIFNNDGILFKTVYMSDDGDIRNSYEMIKVNLDSKYKDVKTWADEMFSANNNRQFYENNNTRISLVLNEEKKCDGYIRRAWAIQKDNGRALQKTRSS